MNKYESFVNPIISKVLENNDDYISSIPKREIEKKVIWHWDLLGTLLLILVTFPYWIRESIYYKIKLKGGKTKGDI